MKEAVKIILQFPNLKPTKDEQGVGWKSSKETQPILINSKVPGLITQWKAPFERGIEGTKRRQGRMTLAIINPTSKTLTLLKTVLISNYRPAKIIKKMGGKKDSEAMLVLGPHSPNSSTKQW